MRALAAFLLGEALLLTGLYFVYWPAALVAAGVQMVVGSLRAEIGEKR